VFVNASYRAVMDVVQFCDLPIVQLHGQEPPQQVQRLRDAGLVVWKALFHRQQPFFDQAGDYNASAFLLECGTGRLPGGNARTWDWAAAAKMKRSRPVVLAGGLDADNIPRAIRLGRPDAVDVSSGVELTPGVKDMQKVSAFIKAVVGTRLDYYPQKIR
jgi:phosphoribosylanthranilate isomerase